MSFKEDILTLRESGKSYSEIKKELGCSQATISYHCKNYNLQNIGLQKNIKIDDQIISEIKEYYKTHTAKEVAIKFNISISSVKKYSNSKQLRYSIEERNKRQYQRIKTLRQKTKEKALEYKGKKCSICGYDKCSWALEFHHINPNEKEFTFSKYSNHAWSKIQKELDKCILVCANCHKELHYKDYIEN